MTKSNRLPIARSNPRSTIRTNADFERFLDGAPAPERTWEISDLDGKVEHAATIPLNRIAVINLLVRAHAALRSVDVLPDLPAVAADRVSDAIAAIEEFASERGIEEIVI